MSINAFQLGCIKSALFLVSILFFVPATSALAQHWGKPIFEFNKDGERVSLSYSGPYAPILEKKTPDFSWIDYSETLKRIQLSHMKIPTELIALLVRCDQLNSLQLGESIGPGETEIEVGAYEHLGKLKGLEKLELVRFKDGGHPGRSDFKFLSKLTKLRKLSVFDTLTPDDLQGLLANKNLEYIYVDGLETPRPEQLRKLGALKYVAELHLGFNTSLNTITPLIDKLHTSKRIKAITVASKSAIDEQDIKKICNMTTLRHLELGGVRSQDLPLFSKLKQIEVLRIRLVPGAAEFNFDFANSIPNFRILEVISDNGTKAFKGTLR